MHLPDNLYYKHFPVIDSTMLAIHNPDGQARTEEFVLFEADEQTAGRGQRGTQWEAAAGKNLLFSLRCRPTFVRADEQFRLSETAALAIVEALRPYTECRVKWPNDVYVGDRKICGMLIEHVISGAHIAETIVGPGINVNQTAFLGDAPNPISLRQLLGRDTDRYDILEKFLLAFIALYRQLERGEGATIDAQYKSLLYRAEGFFAYRDKNGEFQARIADVEPCGRLVLEDGKGTRRHYAFKEVAYVLP